LARFLPFFIFSSTADCPKYCENTSFPGFAGFAGAARVYRLSFFLVVRMTSPQILNILHYPDPRLNTVARPVNLESGLDARLLQLIANMRETMYDAKGIGLAATQVDVHEQLIVIDVSEERNAPLVLINPKVIWASTEKLKGDEGCLSVPGIYDGVERSSAIRVSAFDENGKVREIEADGLLAVCIQHEMDHLMGKVFVEYLSPLKRTRIRSKMAKAEREAALER
jgi:peptide deformylase